MQTNITRGEMVASIGLESERHKTLPRARVQSIPHEARDWQRQSKTIVQKALALLEKEQGIALQLRPGHHNLQQAAFIVTAPFTRQGWLGKSYIVQKPLARFSVTDLNTPGFEWTRVELFVPIDRFKLKVGKIYEAEDDVVKQRAYQQGAMDDFPTRVKDLLVKAQADGRLRLAPAVN